MRTIFFTIVAITVSLPVSASDVVLLEAEAFDNMGGWVVDQQFMDLMGSPYVLAHGLGEPVADAEMSASFPASGEYRVWVRTRDWVAPWNAPGAPGRFQLVIDGKPLATTFGTKGADWHWQDGGTVEVSESVSLSLHDLTGFEGRCDAILFCKDHAFQPPNDLEALAKFRKSVRPWLDLPEETGSYDLVVSGGGIAGVSAAVTAARLGLTVALIQDRPVLGGNGSSEVRVWPEGHTNQQPYPHMGDVVNELLAERNSKSGNAKEFDVYSDAKKLAVVRAEPNITLILEHRVQQVEPNKNAELLSLVAVLATHTRSGRKKRIRGRWFLDSTGDGVVGALIGADFEMTEKEHMGVSNLWNLGDTTKNEYQIRCECVDKEALSFAFTKSEDPISFPRCPWAIDLSEKSFPGRGSFAEKKGGDLSQLGGWFWESGFDGHPIDDVERMRDLNFRAMYGAWDTLKNVDHQFPYHRLKWAAYVAGKRESRRLLGDVILTGKDFLEGREFEDGCFPCSWHIDLHHPHKTYSDQHPGNEFISDYTRGEKYTYQGPYWAPYRCLYSRNVDNLFMAGRDISVTHEALGAVRVMRTCGMMGEAVGMAASLCKKHNCTPREIYDKHLDELKALLRKGGSK